MSCPAPSSARARLGRVSAGAAALTATGLLVLTGCGPATFSAAGSEPSSQTGQSGAGRFGGGNRTSGLIADISGKTLQVQSSDAQTAVTWTSKTTFTTQLSQPLSAVKVGACVVAQAAQAAASGSTTITATTIAVSTAENGTCAGGFGGTGAGGATRPSGAPTGMPSGRPSGMPSGGPSGAAAANRPVSGKVTAATGASFTVEVTYGSDSPQSYTVETTGTTKVTAEKSTTSKALKVGTCATVTGKADSTGAVTATAIGLRPATNGTCSFGMGRRGNG